MKVLTAMMSLLLIFCSLISAQEVSNTTSLTNATSQVFVVLNTTGTNLTSLSKQNLALLGTNNTPIFFNISEVDTMYNANSATSVNYGVQLGSCLTMTVVVAALTKPEKRRTPIFILNLLSLIFGALRAVLLAVYFTGPWSEFYRNMVDDYSNLPRSAYATSIAGDVVPILMKITVELSLSYQAWTVCKDFGHRARYTILALLVTVASVVVGFHFAQAIIDSRAVLTAGYFYNLAWIQTGKLASETGSIYFFSIIFVSKLLYTIWNRRRYGWKQWPAVQILVAMGGCTMIIPSIFTVFEFLDLKWFPESGSFTLTVTALMLPLSSLWANAVVDNEAASFNITSMSTTLKPSSPDSELGCSKCKSLNNTLTSSDQDIELTDRKPSIGEICKPTTETTVERVATRDSFELDELDKEIPQCAIRRTDVYTVDCSRLI